LASLAAQKKCPQPKRKKRRNAHNRKLKTGTKTRKAEKPKENRNDRRNVRNAGRKRKRKRTSSPDSLFTAHQRDCAHASPNARVCASEKAFARATARSTRSSTLVGAVSFAREGDSTDSPNPKKREEKGDAPVGVRASSSNENESARDAAERALSVSPHSPTETRAEGSGGVPRESANRRAIAARSALDAGGGPFTASACECARNHASSAETGTRDHPPELRVRERGRKSQSSQSSENVKKRFAFAFRCREKKQQQTTETEEARQREKKRRRPIGSATRTHRSRPSVCNTRGMS